MGRSEGIKEAGVGITRAHCIQQRCQRMSTSPASAQRAGIADRAPHPSQKSPPAF